VQLLKAVEVIIIDEISMVRADVMDAIDYSMRLHRQSQLPFGGVQMLFFGDLFQLPPVVRSGEEKEYFSTTYSSPYFFAAHVFKDHMPLQLIELTQVYRQTDRNFIGLLDSIRTMDFGYEELESFNERYIPDAIIEEPFLTLCSTNAAAQKINTDRLAQIDAPSHYYLGEVKRDFSDRLFPTEYKLELRKGAQVMLIRNDPEKRFVNGSLAQIVQLEEEKIIVRLTNEAGTQEEIELPKMTWEINRYTFSADSKNNIQSEVIGSFTQYPVRLAWAVTIHKSQGQTYDRAAIDLGRGAFEHGQTYVALSRCRTLNGVFLKKPLTPRDIMVDERVVEFYQVMRS
jgi:ATP-dependent exoDNAse (exonuclease V) alpha subunit